MIWMCVRGCRGSRRRRIRAIIGFMLLVSTNHPTTRSKNGERCWWAMLGVFGKCTEFPRKSTRPIEVELLGNSTGVEMPSNVTRNDTITSTQAWEPHSSDDSGEDANIDNVRHTRAGVSLGSMHQGCNAPYSSVPMFFVPTKTRQHGQKWAYILHRITSISFKPTHSYQFISKFKVATNL